MLDPSHTVTITAQGATGTASIAFEVIQPTSVLFTRKPLLDVLHTEDRPDIGIMLDFWIGPDSVNFYRIEVQEWETAAVATCPGIYCVFDGDGHNPGELTTITDIVVAGLGTWGGLLDRSYSGDPGPGIFEPPFTPGSYSWTIPWKYNIGGGEFQDICDVVAKFELAADGVSLSATKGLASGSCKTTSDSSGDL